LRERNWRNEQGEHHDAGPGDVDREQLGGEPVHPSIGRAKHIAHCQQRQCASQNNRRPPRIVRHRSARPAEHNGEYHGCGQQRRRHHDVQSQGDRPLGRCTWLRLPADKSNDGVRHAELRSCQGESHK